MDFYAVGTAQSHGVVESVSGADCRLLPTKNAAYPQTESVVMSYDLLGF